MFPGIERYTKEQIQLIIQTLRSGGTTQDVHELLKQWRPELTLKGAASTYYRYMRKIGHVRTANANKPVKATNRHTGMKIEVPIDTHPVSTKLMEQLAKVRASMKREGLEALSITADGHITTRWHQQITFDLKD
jgi:hypothetical protein